MTKKPKRLSKLNRSKSLAGFGSRTDIGKVRKYNEDSLLVSPPLFAIADGMGGHAAGEVASEVAINTLQAFSPDQADSKALGNAVVQANLEVIAAAQDDRGREGMGCTMTAAMLEGERLVISQVGDSRAYLLHQGRLQQITRDHSLMADMIELGQITPEEARVHPNRSVITRALGSDPHMQSDLYEINVEAGDRLLLCSDGLSTMVDDDRIEEVLSRIGDAQLCADALVNKALAAGGFDNVTVIVADVSGFSEVHARKSRRKVRTWAFMTILALFLVIAAALASFKYYTDNSAYLASNEGKVTIYQGIPGKLFGLEASKLYESTDIEVDTLSPGVAARLEEGIRVGSIDEAQELIEQYREDAERTTSPLSSSKEGSENPKTDESGSSKISEGPDAESPGTPERGV